MRKSIESQIRKITQTFSVNNISRAYNFPKWESHDLVWERFKNLSFALKNESYYILYKECLREGDYNIVMMDGALIQMKYRFYKEEVTEHVLAFYPSPFMERFQDNPDDYFQVNFSGQDLFTEIVDKVSICSPIRFDFNVSDKIFKEVEHPKSHMSIGNYTNCRIPLKNPLTPFRFIKFILRNFYHEKYIQHYTDNYFNCDLRFEETIVLNEKKHLHFNWE